MAIAVHSSLSCCARKSSSEITADELKAEKVIKLIKDAGDENKVVYDLVEKVTAVCETCIKHKRPRPHPVVSLPLGRSSNETVAMDLKILLLS